MSGLPPTTRLLPERGNAHLLSWRLKMAMGEPWLWEGRLALSPAGTKSELEHFVKNINILPPKNIRDKNTENTFGIEVTRLKILCLTVFTALTLCFTLSASSWEEDERMVEVHF